MAHIAVIGPGAIGGTVATRLAEISDHVITVCARSAVTLLTVDTVDGIKTAAPEVLLSPDRGRPVDWVLVATKAYDVAGAAEWLQRLMGSDTRLAVLQNGVEHVERFAPYVSKAQSYRSLWICRSNVSRLVVFGSVVPVVSQSLPMRTATILSSFL